MGLLDDIRRELGRVIEEAKRATEAGPPGPVARPPRRHPAGQQHPAPPADQPAAPGLEPRERLQREGLKPLIPRQPPVPEDPSIAPAFDLEPSRPKASLPKRGTITFTQKDILRAIILGEVIDEPKGRRARRPHPK